MTPPTVCYPSSVWDYVMKHPTMYHHPLETPYDSVVDERQQLSYQGRPILLTLLRPSSPTKVKGDKHRIYD